MGLARGILCLALVAGLVGGGVADSTDRDRCLSLFNMTWDDNYETCRKTRCSDYGGDQFDCINDFKKVGGCSFNFDLNLCLGKGRDSCTPVIRCRCVISLTNLATPDGLPDEILCAGVFRRSNRRGPPLF